MCPPIVVSMRKGGKVIKTAKTNVSGVVKDKKGRTAKTFYVKIDKDKVKPDRVPAILQAGEIVIPKKHATRVKRMLKKANIKLPNM
jgi:hypothetical protein